MEPESNPTPISDTTLERPAVKACPSCGRASEEWSHVCPECLFEWPSAETPESSIWNPMATAWWSLLFSPAFGGILLYKNWQSLGQPSQKKWPLAVAVCAFALITTALIVSPLSLSATAEKSINGLSRMTGLALTYLCFHIARQQRAYIKASGIAFKKRKWLKPMIIASASLVSFLGGFFILVSAVSGQTDEQIAYETQRLVQTYLKTNTDTQDVLVIGLQIQHKAASEYSGIVTLEKRGRSSRHPIEIKVAGDQLFWEISTTPLH